MHRGKKVDEKSCMVYLLCYPAGTSNKLDVQNEWEENTHTHTHTHCTSTLKSITAGESKTILLIVCIRIRSTEQWRQPYAGRPFLPNLVKVNSKVETPLLAVRRQMTYIARRGSPKSAEAIDALSASLSRDVVMSSVHHRTLYRVLCIVLALLPSEDDLHPPSPYQSHIASIYSGMSPCGFVDNIRIPKIP